MTSSKCIICKHKHKFDLPKEILQAIKNKNLIIFAGAGVSTETSVVFKQSLYSEIKELIKIDEDISFSKLMSKFCEQKDGRKKLLHKIKERFDYVNSFVELYRSSTRFHKELATIPQINEIITTNWDDFFERECGAVPIVTAEDFIFWSVPERKVLKIHGSINNYGSIIATESDYKKCYKTLEKGIVGAQMKTLLASKTPIFIGFSFGDEDFNKIYNFLKKQMGILIPHAYIVTIDKNAKKKFDSKYFTPIVTDATYFIEILKKHLVSEKLMLPDSVYERIYWKLEEIKMEHETLFKKLNCKDNPEIIFSAFYQDGMIHAFERIIAKMNTGEYSDKHHVEHLIYSYEVLRKEALNSENYFDAAYLEGYRNGINYLISDKKNRKLLPIYFLFGFSKPLLKIEEYLAFLEDAEKLHAKSYKASKTYAKKIGGDGKITVHHPPFI